MESNRSRLYWPATVLRRQVPKGSRVIAVSDIHGNLLFFQGLMKKLKLNQSDILVIVGDILEKGEESLALLRHLMELEQYLTIWPVCGNCDGLVLRFFEDDSWDPGFFQSYLPSHPESTLRQMAAEIGFDRIEDLPALREALRKHFKPEWAWLKALPTIIETDHLVFVHGGIPNLTNLETLDSWQCMKNDNFLGQGHTFDKCVVVGHWPVTLYRPKYPSAAPLFSRERKILSIDGGCVLKLDGQLNALTFPVEDSETIYWTFFDGLPTAIARDFQEESRDPINIRWGRSGLEVLEPGDEFTLCRHVETGRDLRILTRYLHYRPDGTVWCEDSTDYRLRVRPGDVLSISERVTGGALAKKDGVTGWYFGRLLEPVSGHLDDP